MGAKEQAEEILATARKLIGTETEPVKARYPVEYDPIRRYCHSTGDENPLYLDPDYGKKSRFGGTPVPMCGVHLSGGNGIWPPKAETGQGLPPVPTLGQSAINLTTEWEFLKPVLVGDHLSTSQKIEDVYIKPIRLDPLAFWRVTANVYRNSANEVVAIHRNIGLAHRKPDEVAADRGD